jgi:O-antigen ligase
MSSSHPYVYFVMASITYLFAALSMSRNALLIGAVIYLLSLTASLLYGKNKREARIAASILFFILFIFAALLLGRIRLILEDYFDRGFSDNGRFDLWRLAIETFRGSMLFGNGFYGFFTDAVFEFSSFPRMAHNTVFEVLSAMGIFGILSYVNYRYETLKVFFCRPTPQQVMLGLSALTLILGGFFDNFVFNIHPPLYYTVALALACKIRESEARF